MQKKRRKLFCREWFSATVIFQELASLQQLYLPSTEDCPIILRYLHKFSDKQGHFTFLMPHPVFTEIELPASRFLLQNFLLPERFLKSVPASFSQQGSEALSDNDLEV